MIFEKPQVDTEDNPNSAVIKFSPKSVAFNYTHSVYIDIFVKPSTINRRDTQSESLEIIKENVWIVLNYFEVTTFDGACDFLWGETIDDELSYNSFLTVTEYETVFDLVEKKTSMIHRKMQQELKDKNIKNNSTKI